MLNEAAETKAWWNGFDDAGVHHLIPVEATIQSAMDSTKQQLQEAETALEKIKDSERQGVSELEIKAAFSLLKMLENFWRFCWGCDSWWKNHHIQHEKSNGLSMFAAVFRWMLWLKLKWRCNPWRRRRKRPYFGKHQTDHGSKIKKRRFSSTTCNYEETRFRVSHVSEHGLWQSRFPVFQRLRSQHRSSLKIKMTSWWASSFVRRARPTKWLLLLESTSSIPHRKSCQEYFFQATDVYFCLQMEQQSYAILVGYSKLRCLCSETVFSWTNWVVNGKAKSKNIAINEGACDPWNLNQWRKYYWNWNHEGGTRRLL